MANSWFQFKEFKIEQDCCAMKVSTDACIQGALAAGFIMEHHSSRFKNILDIGTGTGLLSLMIAQKNPGAEIEAIEIEANAVLQAGINFQSSPWEKRMSVTHTSLQGLAGNKQKHFYDFIICNPPFFQNQLQSGQKERNIARHGIVLSPVELLNGVKQLLSPEAVFCVLYADSGWPAFLKEASAQGLYLKQLVHIRPKSNKPYNRHVAFFSGIKQNNIVEESLVIYDEKGNYTPAFTALLEDYYL